MKQFIPFLIIGFLSIQCTREVPCGTYEEQHSTAYIDLSGSRDSVSVVNSIKKIQRIFLAQPKSIPSRFVVKVIDSDKSVAPLFDFASIPLSDKRHESVEKYKLKWKEAAQKIKQDIWYYFKNIAPNKESSNQSCICNSLVNSISSISQIDTCKCKIQLFVFTDLFEECKGTSSYFEEGFSMCNGEHGRKNSLKKLKQIIKDYTPNTSLKKYVKPENLYFITDENDLYNESSRACLDTEEVRLLWHEILIKMGYSRHELDRILIDGLVPAHLLKTDDDV